jgi:hypothetical protein
MVLQTSNLICHPANAVGRSPSMHRLVVPHAVRQSVKEILAAWS